MNCTYHYTLTDSSMRDNARRPFEFNVNADNDNAADMEALNHVRRIIGLKGSYKFGAWEGGFPDTAPVLFSAKPGEPWIEIAEAGCVCGPLESID